MPLQELVEGNQNMPLPELVEGKQTMPLPEALSKAMLNGLVAFDRASGNGMLS